MTVLATEVQEIFAWHNAYRARTRASDLLGAQAIVYNVLQGYAWMTPMCWPTQAQLAHDTGYSREHVNRVARQLKDLGLLDWFPGNHCHGRWPGNVYVLLDWTPPEQLDHTVEIDWDALDHTVPRPVFQPNVTQKVENRGEEKSQHPEISISQDIEISSGLHERTDLNEIEQYVADLEKTKIDQEHELIGMRVTIRSQAIQIGKLKSDLDKLRETEPESADVKRVLEAWKVELEKDRAKIPLAGERAKYVRKWLNTYTVSELMEMIAGLKLRPCMDYGRRSKSGRRADDLIDALKNEKTIDELIELARGKEPEAPVTIDEFVDRLHDIGGARAKETPGGQWTARCPAHDDNVSSLSFRQGDRGIVAHCHAGCTASEIAAAIEVPLSRWFEKESEANTPEEKPQMNADPLTEPHELDRLVLALQDNPKLLGRIRKTRGWTAETLLKLGVGFDRYDKRLVLPVEQPSDHGNDLHLVNVMRYSPVLKPKMIGISGRPRGLFPPPEKIPNWTIWIVEGEPDAITANSIGLPAVAVPGANGWRSEWAERFRSRLVVVCCDCDAPGRKLAAKIVQDLVGIAEDVHQVDLDEDRDDGYDLTDAVREGCTMAILERMADRQVDNQGPTGQQSATPVQ